jgi:NADH dehydrogenase
VEKLQIRKPNDETYNPSTLHRFNPPSRLCRVVIIGGGFGGLYAAKALRHAPARVTLVDKRNFHLFQPLLYQVATGDLAAADIAYPLREIFKGDANFEIIAAEAVDMDPEHRRVVLRDGEIGYDTLIVATGSSHHYFGNAQWANQAPGLKTVEDALEMRRRIFLAFEAAEREPDPARQKAWMTFVIVGGGPTGVELAGSLGDLVQHTLKRNFRRIDPQDAEILLIEGFERILPPYPPELSAKAARTLRRLSIKLMTGTFVTEIHPEMVALRNRDRLQQIQARTVLWCAGVHASPLGKVLAEKTGAQLDRNGRINVQPDLSLPGYSDIFVVGDLANFIDQNKEPLPAIAPVAIQQGQYVGKLIQQRLRNRALPPFHYRDKGNLAVIGRNSAVANLKFLRFNGFLAWVCWAVVHISYLIGFRNKVMVLFQWGWYYVTRKRVARLITGGDPFPVLESAVSERSVEEERAHVES